MKTKQKLSKCSLMLNKLVKQKYLAFDGAPKNRKFLVTDDGVRAMHCINTIVMLTGISIEKQKALVESTEFKRESPKTLRKNLAVALHMTSAELVKREFKEISKSKSRKAKR